MSRIADSASVRFSLVVVNPDGTFELFEGDVVSKESIIDNIPDDSFGYMMTFNNPGWEARCSEYKIDKPIDRNCSAFVENDGVYTVQFWTSNTRDIYDIQIKMNKLGHKGSLEIYDNGDGTYSAVIESSDMEKIKRSSQKFNLTHEYFHNKTLDKSTAGLTARRFCVKKLPEKDCCDIIKSDRKTEIIRLLR